jgi:tetratricopeptide (TPR) repeat protein
VFSLSLDKRREQIIEIINEELSEVSRLAKQTKYKNPDHLLRMAELNLEKARLWREKENQEYLALSNKKRRQTNKKRYFKKSTSYFNRATKYCKSITKRYKKYKNMPDVYYILGFNAKESGNTKLAAKYLSLATKKSRKNSTVNIRSKISLAELYFNKKQFSKAIPLYEKALRYHKDKWWTKDSFNLAWCYYRTKKRDKAIAKMKEVFSKSKNSKYVDMSDQVQRDIGVMFATTSRVNEGIRFYKNLNVDFVAQLLIIAKSLKTQGKYSEAVKVLGEALRYEKREQNRILVHIEQLDLFSKYNRYARHLSVTNTLFNYYNKKKIDRDAYKKLLFHAKKQGAILQKQVASKTYKRLRKTRNSKAKMATRYFYIVASISPKDFQEYKYLEAETYALVAKKKDALNAYWTVYTSGDGKFKKRAMDGTLSSLNTKYISSKDKNVWYEKVYPEFIKNYRSDKRHKIIYQKLFKVYSDQRKYKIAKNTLDQYAKDYPRDYKIQEAMIGNLVDIDRKNKDKNAIKVWILAVDNKKYTVTPKYRLKLRELLTSMQIGGVQKDLERGNKAKALAGYKNVLKDPYATPKAKINAKYNIAALYFELRDVDNSYKWSLAALRDMNSSQTSQFADSFVTIAKFYFMKLQFNKSIALQKTILDKLCSRKNRTKNTLFKNASYLALSEGKIKEVDELISKASICGVSKSYITEVEFSLLDEYRQKKMYREYEFLVNKLAQNPKNTGELISDLEVLISVNRNLGNQSKVAQLKKRKMKYYALAKKKKYKISADDYDAIILDDLAGLSRTSNRIKSMRLSFPEKIFNSTMQRKLKLLDTFTNSVIKVQKVGSAKGIIESYKTLIDTYDAVIKSIDSFSPPGKSTDYVKSFKMSMSSLTKSLKKTKEGYRKSLLDSISKNNIISNTAREVLVNYGANIGQYHRPAIGFLMDKGGMR